MAPFSSTAISSIDYRPGHRELLVRFTGGEQYAYDCVPRALYRDLIAAESKGRFFAQHIRDRFPHRRLGLGRRPTTRGA